LAVGAASFALLYLLRITPRNEGTLHGGGFEGADAAFGYPPLSKQPIATNEDDANAGNGPEETAIIDLNARSEDTAITESEPQETRNDELEDL
jgi:hypothetical protein